MKTVAPDNPGSPLANVGPGRVGGWESGGGARSRLLSPTRRAGRLLPLQSGERAGAEPKACALHPGPLSACSPSLGASRVAQLSSRSSLAGAPVAVRMAWVAGGALASGPGLTSKRQRHLRLPGGPPHRRR